MQNAETSPMRRVPRKLDKNDLAVIDSFKRMGDRFIEHASECGGNHNAREMALARTKMEEAVMWAVKGITA